MVQVRNVTIEMSRDSRILLENFSFTVGEGEKCALIGEEGNGKSTLLKWMYRPSLVQEYALVTGSCIMDEACGYLPQELPEQDRTVSVGEWMEEHCELYSRAPADVAQAAATVKFPMDGFYSEQRMGTLSGGERVKVQIAALLLNNCSILLLDEPSNDLDIETLEWLETFLQTTPKTVLYVSHDEVLLERTATMILHFEQIRRKTIPRATAARCSYRDYMQNRASAMAHQSEVAFHEQKEFQKKKERYLSIYQSVEHAQESISRADPAGGRLLKKKMHAVTSLGKRLEKEQAGLTEQPEAEWAILPKWETGVALKNGKPVLRFGPEELSVDGRILARNVVLNVTGPEHVCIIGKNGCGKTTLMRRLTEELLHRTDLKAGYMPQQYGETLDSDALPAEFLSPAGDKETVTKARIYLGSMKYTAEEMDHPVRELSGGQKAKLLLLKMILDGVNVLLLDEPTRNLSPLSAPAVRTLLKEFPGAIICISHDRKLIEEVADTVYRMTEKGLVRE